MRARKTAGEMKLYHISKRIHTNSILTKGLIPAYRKGLTVAKKQEKVFLTNDVERILKTQAGEKWCKRWDPVVFEVDVTDLNVSPVKYIYNRTYTLSDFEFEAGRIEPSRLKLVA
jgi:hypothetical protein